MLTGATGFIGSHALRLVSAAGHDVHVVGRTPPASLVGVTFHPCDLMDPVSTAAVVANIDAEALLHLAWYAEPRRFWSAVENVDWVAASLMLVRSFAACGAARRLVVAGSCAEYSWSEAVLDESTSALIPSTLYGSAKLSLYQLLQRVAGDLGLSMSWGRIFFAYGPNEKPERLLGALLAAAAANRPVHFTAGTQRRDFMHVADVAAALVALTESNVTGPVNIATGQCVAVREFIELAAESCGAESLLHFGTIPMPANEPPSLIARIQRLRDEVGFVPNFRLHTGLFDAVTKTLAAGNSGDAEAGPAYPTGEVRPAS